MIGYTYRRPKGGRRYSSADRATARALANAAAPFTLTDAARAAMVSAAGIETFAEATFELESNRLRRPTTTRFLVDGVEAGGVWDPNVDLASGRYNPTGIYAVADVSLADDAVVPPDAVVDGVEVAGRVAGVTLKANPANGDASTTPAAGVRGEWRIGGVLDGDPSTLLSRSTAPGDAGRILTGLDRPVLFHDAGVGNTLAGTGRTILRPASVTPTRYLIPGSGTRSFTVAAVVAAGVAVEVTPRVVATLSTGATVTLDGDPVPVPAGAVTGTRVAGTVEITAPAGTRVTRLDPRLVLSTPGAARRVEVVDVTVYAGDDRGDVGGTRPVASTPLEDVVVEHTWTGPRRVNRVDVAGDLTVGAITAASLEYRRSDGSWSPAGELVESAGSGNRLAIVLPDVVEAYGVRVHVEETNVGEGGPVTVTEVDPQYVLDVTDDVVTLGLEWSRETDPGTATSPVGNYEASIVTLELENTSGAWNPQANASLDVGHRIEVALGVRYTDAGTVVEELFPAGVFYSDPFGFDSDAVSVQIRGVDRLGRYADVELREELRLDVRLDDTVRDLALRYLDLNVDQIHLPTAGVNDTTIPYASPAGKLGSYLADLAKAANATLLVDAYDRVVIAGRGDVLDATPVAEIRADNALIGYRRPPGYDSTTSIVTVNASPLSLTPSPVELWKVPDDGLDVPVEGLTLLAFYSTSPALNVYVDGLAYDPAFPAVTVAATRFYAGMAEIDVAAAGAGARLTGLAVMGQTLEETPLAKSVEDAASVARYGRREITVDARLVQTQTQLDEIAFALLQEFRALDDDGIRRLPDVELDSLGLLHVEAGDVVALSDPRTGLGSDYVIVGRSLAYADGAILGNGIRARTVSTVPSGIADVSLSDDVAVAGY